MPVPASMLNALDFRSIGPHRGGRVVAVAGDPVDPATFYFGACTGGVWKTTDGGSYWANVSDGFFQTSAVGALEVADSDANVIYAGMGETAIRGNVSHGDGVYRSSDAGRTWHNVGLKETRFIGRIQIHPTNPDLVYVAALGHAFGPNPERGVYRSKDGGHNWELVCHVSDHAGAVDISMDRANPRVLYAGFWETIRRPWELVSGGLGSGVWRTMDGGDTWQDVSANPGLPKGLKGKIGVAASPAKTGRVWALIEAEDGGLYRSDDYGDTWQMVSDNRELRQRPWYYMHVFADPREAGTVYVNNLRMWKSTDGGRNFTAITTPHGDNHALWIDPRNNRRMVQGNDGGANVSFNGGESWSTIYNQPTAQFYHVTTDNQLPYRVYGTQQDNSAISTPSRSYKGAIAYGESYPTGSSESGHIAVRPDNPNIVYSGAIGSAPGGGGVLLRYDHSTGQVQIITVWPEAYGGWGAKDIKHRFQWTYPIVISPHDPDTLYVTGERVFKTTNEGMSWQAISPDLTRNDPDKMGPSGGPITKDTTGAEFYCTIFAFTESPHQQGVFWAGSDDGLVHLSTDNGATWNDVTPNDLPEWSTINVLEVSPFDPATCYLAAWRYKLEDNRPLLFKTTDYGKTWTSITNGIPADDFTRCIRADARRQGLLYAGTETGLYFSFDDGANWQRVQNNLPVTPIYDLQVKDDDLVIGTHGRSFYILDDLTALREMTPDLADRPVHLFTLRDKVRMRPLPGAARQATPGQKNYMMGLGAAVGYTETKDADGNVSVTVLDGGRNPEDGVVVSYWLKERPEGELKLEFLDEQGEVLKTVISRPGDGNIDEPRAPKEAGANRFVWNMRVADAVKVPGDVTTEQSIAGPVVPPGRYRVRLSVNGSTLTQPLAIVKDPRVKATQEDFDAQFEMALKIRDKLSEANGAVNRIRTLKTQIDAWAERAKTAGHEGVQQAATALRDKLTVIEEELIQPRAKGQLDTINFPTKLNAKIAALSAVVMSADTAPPQQAHDVYADLSARLAPHMQSLDDLVAKEVPGFNTLVQQAALPALTG